MENQFVCFQSTNAAAPLVKKRMFAQSPASAGSVNGGFVLPVISTKVSGAAERSEEYRTIP
jgi:hypothetical protein